MAVLNGERYVERTIHIPEPVYCTIYTESLRRGIPFGALVREILSVYAHGVEISAAGPSQGREGGMGTGDCSATIKKVKEKSR